MENVMIDVTQAQIKWVSRLYFYFLATNTLFGRITFLIISIRTFLDLATAATYSPYSIFLFLWILFLLLRIKICIWMLVCWSWIRMIRINLCDKCELHSWLKVIQFVSVELLSLCLAAHIDMVCDGVWLQGVDALVERCPGSYQDPSSVPPFLSSPHHTSSASLLALYPLSVSPFLPLLPSQQFDHPSTLLPHPSLSLCLCLLYPHVSIPSWLLWPDIKVKSLPPSVFLLLPPLTLHFLCSVAILKFLSLAV